LSRRDGTFDCDIVYANISEALRATKLNRTELGDRFFNVELVMNKSRFLIGSNGVKLNKAVEPATINTDQAKTVIVYGFDDGIDEAGVKDYFSALIAVPDDEMSGSGSDVVLNVKMVGSVDSGRGKATSDKSPFALVEFVDRDVMIKCIEASKEKPISSDPTFLYENFLVAV
jgi:hypothetical protein